MTTLHDLRKENPYAEFVMFDRDGNEIKHTPHLYSEVLNVDRKSELVGDIGEEFHHDTLFITLK